ncbi:hypothetical protein BCR34DRAFT_657064, partial [Clohesyomyces aquaticus]
QPVHSRAWILQGRFLSSRIIFYNSHHATWECAKRNTCEWGTRAGQDIYGHDPPNNTPDIGPLLRFENELARPKTSSEIYDIFHRWNSNTEQYSERKITVPSDRLPALSGIAAMFQAISHDDVYIAGLWQSTLPASMLCWVNTRSKQVQYKEYLAPSWP